ncbi:MAG: Gfo/Idh/MocA family oxidoreductase [Planctomycetales bacterium]|nr:Gfo/Idh/MocA family oxidoreductase [Planctomycetales bacterium]
MPLRNDSKNHALDRRNFLGTSAASATAMAFSSTPALAADDSLRVAVIGTGSQGSGHVERFSKLDGVELVYVCDVDTDRRNTAAKRSGATPVDDLRRILDDKTIDAVSIATPDHWHAPAAILACDADKHVYVEKPCCHNFREGQLLVEAARRNKRVVQHGTQQRSKRFTADAIQMLKEGVIGEVLMAKAWNVQRRRDIGKASASDPPEGFDYDMWIGPAPMVPFQSNRHHYNWHWWYAFGTGDLGNDGVHDLDYARWGLGVETLPNKIMGLGGKYYFDDDQQFPDTQTVVFEYGDGRNERKKQLMFEMRLWSRNYPYNADSGAEFYGTQGKMMLSKRGKLEVFDDSNKRVRDLKPKTPAGVEDNHYANFVDSIRTGRSPNAEIEIGFRSAALCNLGNLATRLGRTIELDPKTQTIVNDDQANAMLGRDYRKGGHWAIPKGAIA